MTIPYPEFIIFGLLAVIILLATALLEARAEVRELEAWIRGERE